MRWFARKAFDGVLRIGREEGFDKEKRVYYIWERSLLEGAIKLRLRLESN